MLDLMERAIRGQATDAEREQLREWRRTRPEREREYQAIRRLLEMVQSCHASEHDVPPPPRAAAIIALMKRVEDRKPIPSAD